MNRIAVLGPGAVGGLMAALFWRQGLDVVCVARDRTADRINSEGLHLESDAFGNFTARPRALGRLDCGPDVLFVATKATSLRRALERIPPRCAAQAVVVPFLNGIEHIEVLRAGLGHRVAPAAVSVESKKLDVNRVAHLSPGCRVRLGSSDLSEDLMRQTAELFQSVGINCEVVDDENEVLWGKLIRLNALACTTAACGKPIGYIRDNDYWYDKLKLCLVEGAAVADARGVPIDIEEDLAFIAQFPDDFTTSMQRDLDARREPELDAIAGAVVRAGAERGIDCPTICEMMNQIRASMTGLGGADGVSQ